MGMPKAGFRLSTEYCNYGLVIGCFTVWLGIVGSDTVLIRGSYDDGICHPRVGSGDEYQYVLQARLNLYSDSRSSKYIISTMV